MAVEQPKFFLELAERASLNISQATTPAIGDQPKQQRSRQHQQQQPDGPKQQQHHFRQQQQQSAAPQRQVSSWDSMSSSHAAYAEGPQRSPSIDWSFQGLGQAAPVPPFARNASGGSLPGMPAWPADNSATQVCLLGCLLSGHCTSDCRSVC